MSLPRIATRQEWLAARQELLAREKELTRQRDELNAERRRLPMVEVGKDYLFDGRDGRVHLIDLFQGRRQLIIYHFMFDPEWEDGCPSCSAGTDELSAGFFDHLHTRDTSYAMVSRAPLAKLERWKARKGWDVPWYSSFGTRLQLRLRRHDRRVGRIRRLQLPYRRRVCGRGRGLLRLPSAVRDAGPELLPAGRRAGVPHLFPVRARPGVARAARTTSWISPLLAGKRNGRSRRGAASRPGPLPPISPRDRGHRLAGGGHRG